MGVLKKDHIRAILSMPRVREAWTQKTGRTATESDVEDNTQG